MPPKASPAPPKSRSSNVQTRVGKRGEGALREFRKQTERDEAKLRAGEDDGDDNYYEPEYRTRVPPDQEKLTEEQLDEQHPRSLRANNPKASQAIARYSYKDSMYKAESSIDHLAVHFSMDSELLWKDSDEAIAQRAARERAQAAEKKNAGTQVDLDVKTEEILVGGRLLRNQFNFSERAQQTYNNPMRDRKVSTEPAPTEDFSGLVTHWEIYDTYLEDLDRQLAGKQIKEGAANKGTGKPEAEGAPEVKAIAPTPTESEGDLLKNPNLNRAIKLMERIVNQNAEIENYEDFKYYEDQNEHRPEAKGRGSFLPLWRFQFDKAKRKTVTAITWNPEYADLFAVGFGSYDFMKQGGGVICCFSLKNTSYPEYQFTTESGVLCLDFHPQHPALLAAGCYDGSVMVFDVRSKTNKPIYVSSNPKVKHTSPVWQVRWQKDDPGKPISFHSVSSDGRVTSWTMHKNELVNEEVVTVKLVTKKEDSKAEDATLAGLASACCFDFSKHDESLFVVGTEEGAVHSYSKTYHSQQLRAYDGHHMPVYASRWNPFHPRVFMTCSADWTAKIWEQNTSGSLMTFDLSTSVSDIAWAPYSSTVFAAVTSDGRLRLFDLSVNRHEPLGETRVIGDRKSSSKSGKARLTHLAFNPKHPIICVGDDRGDVKVFKMTANLYRMSAPRLEDLDVNEEMAKLDRLLIIPDKTADAEVQNALNVMSTILPPGKAPAATTSEHHRKDSQGGAIAAIKIDKVAANGDGEKLPAMNGGSEGAKAAAA